MNVQAWLADDPVTTKRKGYELFDCPACTQIHFINRSTGKLLGDTK